MGGDGRFFWFYWVYIRYFSQGGLGLRPYGVSLCKSGKVTKALLPHHLVPRLGSACPLSGIVVNGAP
ncbi:hypothetical protein FQ186_11780 [Pseudomonas sp. ANT_H14]|nr:hypothetical protein FQ182_08490 [Pseudomonas sp. ANT_H4]KAA0952406.1 hypothetical protein FQ186_11780 [Pseudomonas sp. ANT_H14]